MGSPRGSGLGGSGARGWGLGARGLGARGLGVGARGAGGGGGAGMERLVIGGESAAPAARARRDGAAREGAGVGRRGSAVGGGAPEAFRKADRAPLATPTQSRAPSPEPRRFTQSDTNACACGGTVRCRRRRATP